MIYPPMIIGLRRQREEDILSDTRPPVGEYADPCNLCECCGERPALDDGALVNTMLCGECATDLAADAAEMAREDCRVGLCCSNAPGCSGLCDRGSH